MFPSTVRRIATVAPQSPLLASLTSLAPSATRATASLSLHGNPGCVQRRRYSSSKPSSPNDSPKGYPAGQVTASPTQSTKQSGEKRRRKVKDASPQRKLPSVPSTQDIPQEALAMATFFSLHRPISVTHSFPKAITDDAFAQIFTTRTKSTPYNKVMSRLARTVEQLEQPMQGLGLTTQQAGDGSSSQDANGTPVQHISLKHPDGTESSIYVQLDHMSGQFLPFHPPPIPQALPESGVEASAESEDAVAAPAEDAPLRQEPQTRVYKAMLTLIETIDEDGNTRVVARAPQLIEEDGNTEPYAANSPQSFLERMAMRQVKCEQSRGQKTGIWIAISVKRQRKLKMKKKKYKKLMKRTRNERRKLHRI